MNFVNRTYKLPVTSNGVVNAVLAIILVLTTLGICISWFVRTFGLFIGLLGGDALIVAVCGAFILLANIRHVLEESRVIGTDFTRQGKGDDELLLP